MNRILSTFIFAGSLSTAAMPAIADELRIDLPAVDWQQCLSPSYPKSSLEKDEEGLVMLGAAPSDYAGSRPAR